MDVMSLRRGLLMQMASGVSIFDSMLEVVDSYTPTEVVESIDFSCDASEGAYIVISNPPGNVTNATQQSYGDQILQMVFFAISGISSKSIRSPYTITSRQTPGVTTEIDYWAPTVTIGTDIVSVKLTTNGAKKYVPGFTYYLIKVKGM